MSSIDTIVIGAGAAGLAATSELKKAGLRVLLIEARERVGGRAWSATTDLRPAMEYGAEFIHAADPYLLSLLNDHHQPFYDVPDEHLSWNAGKLRKPRTNFWKEISEVCELLDTKRSPDRSVADFLKKHPRMNPRLRAAFASFAEGFEACDLELIGERGMAIQENTEVAELNGNDLFKPLHGFGALMNALAPNDETLKLGLPVEQVHWDDNGVRVITSTGEFKAKTVIVATPLGVLKAGKIKFTPEPRGFARAISSMHMGHCHRITFEFKDRFWESLSNEKQVAFLRAGVSEPFPAWWTQAPFRNGRLIAWQGGPLAQEMSAWPVEERVEVALKTLAKITQRPQSKIRRACMAWHTHCWSTDLWSLGAYSYWGVEGFQLSQSLARPYGKTLFFAGEHTARDAGIATVHGALQTGVRAAHQVIKTLR